MFDVALKTALVSATLFVPKAGELVDDTHCGIEKAPPGVQRVVVQWGDTLARIVGKAGGHREEVAKVRFAVRREHNLNKMSVGDVIDIHVRDNGDVTWFRFRPHMTTAICAKRTLRDTFTVRREELEPIVEMAIVEAPIEGSLVDSFEAVGEEASLAVLVDDLFPMTVVRSKDDVKPRVRVLVERRSIEDRLLDYGRILAAEYRAEHKTQRVFLFTGANGQGGYYDAAGNPRRTQRLRPPIPGARIASTYGYRDHPIRRRRRMHRGVDYSAARGAAVSAAANGTVVSAKWEGHLGKMVAIRHADGLVTHYAHLSAFARRARAGKRVRQGQVIGYVGSTGLSTGAHLHFETLIDGKYMDPQRLSAKTAPALTDADLDAFHAEVRRLMMLLAPDAGQTESDA